MPRSSRDSASEVDLIPRPRHVRRLQGECPLGDRRLLARFNPTDGSARTAAAAVGAIAPEQGRVSSPAPKIIVTLASAQATPTPRPAQWYSLQITGKGIHLQAADEAGFRHGATTLRQLLRSGHRAIQAMEIEDWPDFPVRGVMLDISRDKVPTLATLKKLIDLLAQWKINQLQLYTEHTFAYRGHERVWRGASPLTGPQAADLDRYCSSRGIDLVPNQNSFGHMERWLRHKPYAALAEAVGTWKTPWGDSRSTPATLNPLNPRSIRLIRDLYSQLLPHFASRFFNVGCDETWELGQGRSREACRKRGVGRVYLDFLQQVHREVKRHGRRMMFWADVAFQHPELISKLPRDAIAMVWGYEADHPFDRQCRLLARQGLQFYVCPGTSTWCSFAGRTSNCLANLRNAAASGRAHGAEGYLVTDWGDFGHRQYLPASYCGLLYGAAVSWCLETNTEIDVAGEVSRHAFGDPSGEMGRLWLDAGAVHELAGVSLKNRTVLFSCLQADLTDPPALNGLTSNGVCRMRRRIDDLIRRATKASAPGLDGALVREELLATLAVLRHACDRAAVMLDADGDRLIRRRCQRLARGMEAIIEQHRKLWRRRNRSGGLSSSIAHYRRNLRQYLSRISAR